MKEFSIVHVSDLHITPGNIDKFNLLIEAIKTNIQHLKIPKHNPVLLLVTGDTVNNPTQKNVGQAETLIYGDKILQDLGLFEIPIIISGNHDVKILGNFLRNKKFTTAFELEPSVKGYDFSPLGLQIIGIDSTKGNFAQGSVSSDKYVEIFLNYYKSENPLKLFALHHNPLPLVDSENKKILGVISDEPFMCLKRPASFLQVASECGSQIVLHGHRHVAGLVQYSVPKATSDGGKQWSNTYVISCPSSTGHDSDNMAGFNILCFELINQKQFVTIHRYIKTETSPYEEIEIKGIEIQLDGNYSMDTVDDFKLKFESLKSHKDYNQNDVDCLLKDIFESDIFQIDPERDNWNEVVFLYKWTTDQIPNLKIDSQMQNSVKSIIDSLNGLVQCILYIHSIPKDDFEEWWMNYEEKQAGLIDRRKLKNSDLRVLQKELLKLYNVLPSNIKNKKVGDYK